MKGHDGVASGTGEGQHPGQRQMDVRDLRMLPGAGLVAGQLVDAIVEQCVWGRADVSVDLRLDPEIAQEMTDLGIQTIQFQARLSVAEDLPASRVSLRYRIQHVFARLQSPDQMTPLLTGSKALLFRFPDQDGAPAFWLLVEFVAASHFLRMTMETEDDGRLDLTRIPHMEVDGEDSYLFLADRERTVRELFQSIHAEAHNQQTEFDEIPERQKALFDNLREGGMEHVAKIKFHWLTEDIPSILDNRDLTTQWFLDKLLFLLEHREVLKDLAAGQRLQALDRKYTAYLDISQGGKVLNISLNRPRQVRGMDGYLEKMPRFGEWLSGASPHLTGVRVFLIHHITSESMAMIHAMDQLGAASLHVLFVKYQGIVPDAFLESMGSLPPDRFQFHALRRIRGVDSVEGTYHLSHQYSPVDHLSSLEAELDVGEDDFFSAMRLTAGHLFFRDALQAKRNGEFFVLIEDGGYLAPEINRLCLENRTVAEAFAHFRADDPGAELSEMDRQMKLSEWLEPFFVGSVEHTRNGYDYLAEVEERFQRLAFPAASIAVSDLKVGEEAEGTATSVVHAVETILHGSGKMLCYRNVIVLGSRGAIGRNLVREFGNRLTDGWVAGVDLVCGEDSEGPGIPEGRTVEELPEHLRLDVDLFVGVTGQSPLSREFLEWLVCNGRKKDVYFASGSTKTVEWASLISLLQDIRSGRMTTMGGVPVTLEMSDVRDPQTGIIQGGGFQLTLHGRECPGSAEAKNLLLLAGGMPVNFLYYGVPSEMFDRVLDQLVRLSCWLTHKVRNGHRPERRLLALDKEIPLADLDALN